MSCKDCIALSPKHGLCNIRYSWLVGNWGFGYGITGHVGRFKLKGSAGLTWEFFRSSSLIMWLVDGYCFLLIPVQRIHPLKMALSSWQCSSQKSTPTNLLQCALCLKCSILMVRLAGSHLRVFHSATVSILFFPYTVYADGSICLDILQNRWSPTYDVSSILTSIQVRNHCFSFIGWTKSWLIAWWINTHTRKHTPR